MTPLRKVARFEQMPQPGSIIRHVGAILKLDCGHSNWVAGMEVRPDTHLCTQSPCYQPDRYMGREDCR